MTMPTINLDDAFMNDLERALAEQIIKKDGKLYASKPKKASGEAKYLWRMVAFAVSPKPQHQCLPVTADFDLEGSWSENRELAKGLDDLAQRIEETVPIFKRYGVMNWARVMGAF